MNDMSRGAAGKKTSAMKREAEPGRKQAVLKSVKGAIYALVVTVVFILIFALIVKESNVEPGLISIINQIVKILGIIFAAFIASRGVESGKILAGSMGGILYIVFGYLVFSLIDGAFGDIVLLFSDLAMALLIGTVTAIVVSKIHPKKQNQKKTAH